MSAVPAAAVEVPHGRGKPRPRTFDWPQIAAISPVLAATMLRYLDQVALSLRPSSVTAANGILREFGGFLTTEFPAINGLVEVDREHVEAFERHLGTRLSRNDTGRTLSPTRIRIVLGTLRTFFERVSEWDYPDAPTRVLIFNGDLPTPDDPLPKFLSDPDAAKLMRAAAEADPVRRLVVEMLARTGLRVGEFCELQADAVVFMNGRHWLRVPIGKLHNDRYVPLHPLASMNERERSLKTWSRRSVAACRFGTSPSSRRSRTPIGSPMSSDRRITYDAQSNSPRQPNSLGRPGSRTINSA